MKITITNYRGHGSTGCNTFPQRGPGQSQTRDQDIYSESHTTMEDLGSFTLKVEASQGKAHIEIPP